MLSRLWLLLVAILMPNVTSAYIAMLPKLTFVASPDGSALLRIEPGTWLPENGIPVRPAQATIFLYNATTKTYHATKTFPLRNPVAPMAALISDGAEFIVTCDDWDPEIGCTPNVVVVYRGSGELVKAWALEDIFSSAEIKRFGPFPDNVSLRHWRGEKISISTNIKGVQVWIPPGRDLPWHIALHLDLATLSFRKYPERTSDK